MVKNGDLIGSGGQALVKRTSLSGPNPPDTVAVKEPQAPSKTLDTATIESFFEEAKTWEKLAKRERNNQYRDTDHIVGIVAIGDSLPWVAMEYMDGGSLADRLDSHPEGLPLEETLWITDCLCKGLKLAHDHGVAHLDLKPANVLFRETPGDTWDVPKIADWGLARTLLKESGSMDAFSIEYAAPEQFDSDRFGNPDTHTDIYQLGAIVYEMLTGRPLYTGGQASIMHDVVYGDDPDPPSAHREGVPSAVDEVVMRALSTDKSQRYRGAIELFDEAIQKIQKSQTTTTHSKTSRKTDVVIAGEDEFRTTWPMFQRDPARTGSSTHATGPTGEVTESWQVETDRKVESSPAVVDGSVYVGSWDGNMYVLNAKTGNNNWVFDTESPIVSSPTVIDSNVYFGDNGGRLWALDATTGREQWCFEVPDNWVASSPAVVEGNVYVGSSDKNVYAVDAKTGKEQWSVETGRRMKSPAVIDDTLYIGSETLYHKDDMKDNVYALDTATGEEQWRFEAGRAFYSSPTVVEGTVYIGNAGGNVYALDAKTGEQQWRFGGLKLFYASLAVIDGTVYVGTEGAVYALDAATGDKQWAFETGDSVRSSPAVVDDTVYVGCNDHNVYALDATTGDKQWAFETGDSVRSSPAVVDDTVYVGSDDGSVYALE